MVKVLAIGIGLGTIYSCVGVWQHGKVEIIANDQGNRTTPNYMAFTDIERLLGDAAKNQVAMNCANTVFDTKRLIESRYDDSKIQQDLKHWPFKIINDCGKPKIQVEYKGEIKTFAPEEISSMVLTKTKGHENLTWKHLIFPIFLGHLSHNNDIQLHCSITGNH